MTAAAVFALWIESFRLRSLRFWLLPLRNPFSVRNLEIIEPLHIELWG
ncbi:hypothetical protein DsansV1_C23g0174031 [Dioscorea sansibarensis]